MDAMAMEWTPDEVRQLRYRLGYSQAEMARCLKLEVEVVMAWELGTFFPEYGHCNELLRILNQTETNADRVQRRPIADVMMRDRGLSQIHDFEVLTSIDRLLSKKHDN